ncbi:MAG: hypothetical protein ACE5LC_04495 [Candidatus Aminicenantales bacterium]
MSLEKIVGRVLDDARKEAERITEETKKKAEEMKEKARGEASKLAEALLAEAERKARLEASRLVTQARLEGRIQLLAEKKRIIEEVLEKAIGRAGIDEKVLKKKVILKEGEEEEFYAREKLVEELRPRLESYILEVLGI